MTTLIKFGLLWGLAAAATVILAAVMFQSGYPGAGLSLFMMGLLPVFLAGLRFGPYAAGIAGLFAAVLLAVAGSLAIGLGFFFTAALPGSILTYLAGLHRTHEDGKGNHTIEWYPVGHIVAWSSLIAGGVATLGIFSIGLTERSYVENIKPVMERFLPPQPPKTGQTTPHPPSTATGTSPTVTAPQLNLGTVNRDQAMEFLLRAGIPASMAIGWLISALFNLWLAAKIVLSTGGLQRQWQDLTLIHYPPLFSLGVAASLLGTMLPGMPGIIAAAFTGAFFLAYLLLGMAVLHVITRGMTARPLILGALYFAVLFLQIGIFVVLLGLAEQIFKLRARALASNPPPH